MAWSMQQTDRRGDAQTFFWEEWGDRREGATDGRFFSVCTCFAVAVKKKKKEKKTKKTKKDAEANAS